MGAGSRSPNPSTDQKKTVELDGGITIQAGAGIKVSSALVSLFLAAFEQHNNSWDRLNSIGHWTKAEENALIDAIKEANTALGKDELSRDAPWEVVSQKLEGKRTTMQCRKKWYVRPGALCIMSTHSPPC